MAVEIIRGTVARSLAGHDKGLLLAVLRVEGRYAYTADGKTRSVASPKKKNVIHLAPSATVLSEAQMESDSGLRKALGELSAGKTVKGGLT